MAAESDTERFQRVREIFEAALDRPEADREEFVSGLCGDDADLQREIWQLLSCDDDDGTLGSLLDRGADLLASGLTAGVAAGRQVMSGGRVGPFALRGVLGSGGMGTVYEAEQDEPRRKVALKVLSLGLANEQAVRRFKWEAEVLANLRHSAIAQVHAVGVHQAGDIELPWFAMELVPGAKDLMSYAREHDLSVAERLHLLLEVCDAVHHGHLQGVVHRDLKPQNILVDQDGHAKVIDFGIARSMVDDAHMTEGGIVLGTLHYMSPEQLRGRTLDLRTDVYALGVVAFELIAGRRPFVFEETTPLVVAETVENQDPPLLSTVARGAGRDLEVVIAKALRRNPGDRYASAAEFADDLRAYLEARPVRARAPSTFYQVKMFARRRAGLVTSATAILMLLVGSVIVFWRQNQELERRQQVSERVAQFARDLLDQASLHAAQGADYTVREALDVAAASLDGETFDAPEIEVELRELIGQVYRDLSQPDLASKHLLRARDLWREIEGPRSKKAVAAAMSLVVSLREEGRVAEAERLIESLHDDYDDSARDDLQFWRVQHNRAYIMRHVGKLKDAEALFREVVAARERLLGPDHYDTIVTMHNLGNLYLALRQPSKAQEMLAEALARCERSDHPCGSTLQVADNLAQAWAELGELDRAAAKHREAMAGFEELMGPDNHWTLGCGYHLLKVLKEQKKFAAIETLARDLLERCERVFGKEDYRTMDILMALAVGVQGRGANKEAAGMMQRAFDAIAKDRGEVHPATFNAGHSLSQARIAAAEPAEALTISAHLIALLDRNPDVAKQLPAMFPGKTYLIRAKALAFAGETVAAKAAARQAVALLEPAVATDDELLTEARHLAKN